MEPSHIPKIIQQKAALVRAELLIQAHQRQLVQYIKQFCCCIFQKEKGSFHIFFF